jgi:hypothetical protein
VEYLSLSLELRMTALYKLPSPELARDRSLMLHLLQGLYFSVDNPRDRRLSTLHSPEHSRQRVNKKQTTSNRPSETLLHVGYYVLHIAGSSVLQLQRYLEPQNVQHGQSNDRPQSE